MPGGGCSAFGFFTMGIPYGRGCGDSSNSAATPEVSLSACGDTLSVRVRAFAFEVDSPVVCAAFLDTPAADTPNDPWCLLDGCKTRLISVPLVLYFVVAISAAGTPLPCVFFCFWVGSASQPDFQQFQHHCCCMSRGSNVDRANSLQSIISGTQHRVSSCAWQRG